MTEQITLAHGAGGKAMGELLRELIYPILGNLYLNQGLDSALLPPAIGTMAMTTDCHVVKPLFFPGGSIGSLAVHGTLNDLAMVGAKARYLSLGMILEEGLPLEVLRRILWDLRSAAEAAEVLVVTGDTKVVEKGKGDGCFLITTGFGVVEENPLLGPRAVAPGDRILLSGPIAEHGLAVLMAREQLEFENPLVSDSANLYPLVQLLLQASSEVRLLKDPTRGGVAEALNEMAQLAEKQLLFFEERLPLAPATEAAARLLGIDPLEVANEGKLLALVPQAQEAALLAALRSHPLGRGAVCIGEVLAGAPEVILQTRLGGRRKVEQPLAEQLPRIC